MVGAIAKRCNDNGANGYNRIHENGGGNDDMNLMAPSTPKEVLHINFTTVRLQGFRSLGF